MVRALRAYLMVYDESGEWDISPHRDLESLTEYWDRVRNSGARCSALIHVGFDRPETATLSDLLARFPERVLITASARWAMPEGFVVAPQAVGTCRCSDGPTEMPIYIATHGWGYEISAEELGLKDDGTLLPRPSLTGKPEGWIGSLSGDQPDLYEELARNGISTDADYVSLKDCLPEKLRDVVDTERFQYLRATIDAEDPANILGIAPAWLLNSSVFNLELTVRVANVFRRENVALVRDLIGRSSNDLRTLQNFGRASVRDLVFALCSAIEEGPVSLLRTAIEMGPEALELLEYKATGKPLLENLDAALNALPLKGRETIRGRLGADGRRLTLQEIGEQQGLTRERVRQIEAKYVRRIIESYYWDDVIGIKLDALLRAREEPLFLDLLEAEDEWFRGFSNNFDHLANVIEVFTESRFHVFTIHGRSVVTRITRDAWNDLMKATEASLEGNAGHSWTESDVGIFVEMMAREKGAPDLTPLLLDGMRDKILFAKPTEEAEPVLIGFGRNVEQLVLAVLMEAEAPLHYTEVASRVQQRAKRKIYVRVVHNALRKVGAKLFNRGIYGLLKHFTLSELVREDILSEAEDIIFAWPESKQWHCAELLELLAEQRPDLPEGLTPYLLNIVLEQSQRLNYLGRLVWTRLGSRETSTADRIDVAQAFVSLLAKAGHPLTGKELKEKLTKRRSLSPSLQINPNARMIRLAPGLWGLIDRDVGMSKQKQQVRLDVLFRILQQRQKALHLSEISDMLEAARIPLPDAVDPYLMLSLAQQDPRFRLGQNHLLGLAEWTDFRRTTFAQAVQKIVDEMRDPLSLDEICTRVASLTERVTAKEQVSSTLRVLGAVFDREGQLWCPPTADSAKDPD